MSFVKITLEHSAEIFMRVSANGELSVIGAGINYDAVLRWSRLRQLKWYRETSFRLQKMKMKVFLFFSKNKFKLPKYGGEREFFMETKIVEIARRIRIMREDLEITIAEMAKVTGVSEMEYSELENGKADFSFTFLHHCANRFGVDIIELLTGETPHLTGYTLTRAGKGLPIKRRAGFIYEHLAATFKSKHLEPFLVRAPFSEAAQHEPIHLSTHEGQEFDYILEGCLKIEIDGHVEIMNEGDAIIYDSAKPHGMIAANGAECVFLALVL